MSRAARPRRAPIREAESSIRGEMARGMGPRPTGVTSGRSPFVAKSAGPSTATRTPDLPPTREREPAPIYPDRALPPDQSRALPKRRGAIAEEPGTNPRSKLVELRSKIAILQEQLAEAHAGGAGAHANANADRIDDALSFIDAALAGLNAMAPGKARDSVVRLLDRAKEALA